MVLLRGSRACVQLHKCGSQGLLPGGRGPKLAAAGSLRHEVCLKYASFHHACDCCPTVCLCHKLGGLGAGVLPEASVCRML